MVYRLRFLVQLSRASVSGLVESLELRSLASVIGLVDLRSLVSLKASVFSLVEGLGLRSLGLGGGVRFLVTTFGFLWSGAPNPHTSTFRLEAKTIEKTSMPFRGLTNMSTKS